MNDSFGKTREMLSARAERRTTRQHQELSHETAAPTSSRAKSAFIKPLRTHKQKELEDEDSDQLNILKPNEVKIDSENASSSLETDPETSYGIILELGRIIKESTTTIDCALFAKNNIDYTVKCNIKRISSYFSKTLFIFFLETCELNIPILVAKSSNRRLLCTNIYAIKYQDGNPDINSNLDDILIPIAKLTGSVLGDTHELHSLLDKSDEEEDKNNCLNRLKITNETIRRLQFRRTLRLTVEMVESKASNAECQNSTLKFKTKDPLYNKETRKYNLDFKGRVMHLSHKNFQIISEENTEKVLFQMGKWSNDTYTCDFSYPFNACHAFAIGLSMLD